jgi:hypothetical protein
VSYVNLCQPDLWVMPLDAMSLAWRLVVLAKGNPNQSEQIEMNRKPLSRREFLEVAGLASSSALSIGLGQAEAAQDAAEDSAKPWFVESFEGQPPKGWGDIWSAWGENITTDEVEPPPGGGRHSYRQIWDQGQGWSGLNLEFKRVPGMPAKFGAGSAFYLRYFLRYDPDFDFPDSTGFKQIIIQSDSIVHDRLYFCLVGKEARLGLFFQTVRGASWLHANVNGGPFAMPKGTWVEFQWHLKVSPESEKNGAVKGWVDGKLRWRYENIATIQSGSYVSLSINPTFNQKIEGPRQRRYWDVISMGSGYMR